MLLTDHVIWLPRSRVASEGTYQFRVWCSFEAAMVQLRLLPVSVAGYSLSSRQRSLALLGSFLMLHPWSKEEGGDGLRLLGILNSSFYLVFCAFTLKIFFTCTCLPTYQGISFNEVAMFVVVQVCLSLMQARVTLMSSHQDHTTPHYASGNGVGST